MRRLGFVLAFSLLTAAARGGTELPIELEKQARAQITVRCPFEHLPPCGYAPVEIAINNSAGIPQSWTFEFRSPGYSYRNYSVRFVTALTAPPNAARTFQLLVPLAVREPSAASNMPLDVVVTGPGATGASMQRFAPGKHTGKSVSAFVGISEALYANSWSRLEAEMNGAGEDLAGTRFRVDELPSDWRALAGFAGIWMTGAEFTALSAAQRQALHDWICRGGALFVCGGPELPPEFRVTGFGKVIPMADVHLDVAATAAAVHTLAPTLETQLTVGDYTAAKNSIGSITVNVPLLLGFMAVFAVLAGPINLFVFAKGGRRHRLFWTTPAISLAASALLVFFIVMQDGFGGAGLRIALVQVLPESKQNVVLQQQISRTGAVFSPAFRTRDPVFLAPITLDSGAKNIQRTYENNGTAFAGDWFASRSVQAQWIESIVPARGEVALLNAAAVRDAGAAPIIVSSIGATLDELYFLGDDHRSWRATRIRTGEKVTLAPTRDAPEFLPHEAGSRLSEMWQRTRSQPGHFSAITSDSSALVATLPSIRWRNERVIYVGPMTNAAP